MRNDKPNAVVERSIEFALQIIDYTEQLKENKHYELASQLFRSGTSIGANIHEAQNAQSKKDFIHKMKISAKEADETSFWLKLCVKSSHYKTPSEELLNKHKELVLLLSKIISTTKRNM